MTTKWVVPEQVFDGSALRRGVALRCEDGRVHDILPAQDLPKDGRRVSVNGLVCAGFVDLQVNGGGGVLLNQTRNVDGIRAIIAAHRQQGTMALMPTVITDSHEVLVKAAQAAMLVKDDLGFAGLHIEGPHISVARRGTHKAAFIRPCDNATIDIVAMLRRAGVAVMITVAPEAVTHEQIAKLSSLGAIVSLGHTDATSPEVAAAFAAGAVCATHLYNAMSPMTGRAGGAVGAVINSDAYAGIICDGHHVADDMIGLALRARPLADRMFLVSDAMPTVGGPDRFDLYGKTISLVDGKLVNAEGNLAGAHVTMAQGVARLVTHVGVEPEIALKMAITVPSTLIKQQDLARLTDRNIEELLVLGFDCALVSTLEDYLDTGDYLFHMI